MNAEASCSDMAMRFVLKEDERERKREGETIQTDDRTTKQ
jgi:hypothetical protein